MTPPLHTLTTARLSLHDLVSEADYPRLLRDGL